jgi:toxin ParE1/3/4
MKLVFRELAHQDLADIENRIAADGEERAREFVLRIRRKCERLVKLPYQGRARPDLGGDLRSVGLKPYLIVYRVSENERTRRA